MPSVPRIPAFLAILPFVAGACRSATEVDGEGWRSLAGEGITVRFQEPDSSVARTLLGFAQQGRAGAATFLDRRFRTTPSLKLFPGRASLTAQWRRDSGNDGFQPACWMIASGDDRGVFLLSPRVWATDACQHDATDSGALQRIVAHELIHTLHHQHNGDPRRLQREAEWFEEGIAVLGAGDLTPERKAEVRRKLEQGFAPTSLQDAWNRGGTYAIGGSLVDYLDRTHGRATLLSLVPETSLAGLLARLGTTEAGLLAGWRAFVLSTY